MREKYKSNGNVLEHINIDLVFGSYMDNCNQYMIYVNRFILYRTAFQLLAFDMGDLTELMS